MLHTFYDTYNHKFPLMLVVAREPNDDSASQKTWLSQQFEGTQRCALWNQAHSIIASKFNQPITTRSIKRMCKDNQASPVLIADALPQGLSDKNYLPSEKTKIRLSIPTKAIEDHIDRVFSEKSLIDRVKVVLMSGLNREDFQRSREYYFKCFKKFIPDIPIIQTKFLYGTNMPDIREHIQKSVDGNSAIEHVTRSFELYVGQNKNR